MICNQNKWLARTRGGYLVSMIAALLLLAGCVQRRMTIRSNPPGAFVYVDNYPIGTTPVSTDFVYYGKRQFRLVRDGYETLTVEERLRTPWYEWFGLDFISENLVPWEIRDERQLNFQLVPQQIPPAPELAARGEQLRAESQAQRYIPVAVGPPVAVPVEPSLPPGVVAPPPAPVPVAPPAQSPYAPPPPAGQPYPLPPPGAGSPYPTRPYSVNTIRVPPLSSEAPARVIPQPMGAPAGTVPPAQDAWQPPLPSGPALSPAAQQPPGIMTGPNTRFTPHSM